MVNKLLLTKYHISLVIVNLLHFPIRMASSSSEPRRSSHVFLSFRGPDVGNNFISHLYTALDQAGIYTYIDRGEPSKGGEISQALMSAIEDSRIAIIIFSENYASSRWCLEELTKIMECKMQNDLIVRPVFYKVEPREVRLGRESYGKAMAKHEAKFGKDSEKVMRWKKALFDAGSLTGWHFTDGSEAQLIQQIVKEVSTHLRRTQLYLAKYPVGLDSRVQELQAILNQRSNNNILMVGLWGLGGIGKTTLAKAIYNVVNREFQGSCFLERVRENSRNSYDLVHLQEKLLFDVLLGRTMQTIRVFGVDGGSQLIQDRLFNKKVLIILDDVDDERQLNALAGNCEWFGKGSRIIFTTRNKDLLTSHGLCSDHLYEVNALKHGEALKLFRKHAFLRSQNIDMRSDLVDRFLKYAKGLPLVLEVLGSLLCGKGENEWENTLEELAKRPHKEINDVLKVSYDGLKIHEKEIFLDIACFFKGLNAEYIKKILDSCHFDATDVVQILIGRCLISEEEGTLQMHDLLQLMGMDIVKEECRDDPQKRSRLWLYEDVVNVISGDVGTDAIEAIVLELPKPTETFIGPNAFINMRNLRLLILLNVDTSFQGPIHLPKKLRWFECPNCAWIPNFSNGPKKLVGLDMRKSKIKVVGEQFKDSINLKFINFSECQLLVCMPDLNWTPYLEELDLHGCKNLEHAHESVANHDRLRLLNLSGCSKLHHLSNELQSKNLELLNLNHCSKLQRFPDIPNEIKSLRGLYLIGTSIDKLPASIENLVSLEEMDLRYCKKLTSLPSSIYRLLNLERLTLEGCSKLAKFPKHESPSGSCKTGFPKLYVLNLRGCNLSKVDFLEDPSCFPFLRALYLLGNNFTNVPTCGQLHNLLWLDVLYYQQLQEIPQNPGQLSHLWSIGCESLSKFAPDKCDVEGYPVAEGSGHRLGRCLQRKDYREKPGYTAGAIAAVLATIAIIFVVRKTSQ